MNILQPLIAALPAIATSWQAVVGYVAVVVAFVIVSLKVTRNKNLLHKLQSLPERDRARVLQMEMGAAYLSTGLSPEQWLQQQRQRYFLVAFLAVCVLVVAMTLAAWSSAANVADPDAEMREAEAIASSFLAKLELRDMNGAYDMLPDELQKNLSFAQFKTDMERLLYQLPRRPLRNSIEQSVQNGGFLNVAINSEYSVDTRVRHIVGFAKSTDWRLWQYQWQPVEWPLMWPASTVIRTTPADAMKAYNGLSESERADPLPKALRGSITGSSPGWTLLVTEAPHALDEHRCVVKARDEDSQTAVTLNNVVGGCRVTAGTKLLVHAVLSAMGDAAIQLDAVRYFPVN